MGWVRTLEFRGLKLPIYPIPKVWLRRQVKDGGIHVSESKMEKGWRKRACFLLSFKDSGSHHFILLASYWAILSLRAIAAMESKNCSLYFSGQLS